MEHITQMPRRTVVSFTDRLQPAVNGIQPAAPANYEGQEYDPPAPPASCAPTCTPASTETSSPAGANPDVLLGLLETFLTERQSQGNPATAFGSYVDGSLRSLPPVIRRNAEYRIMEVLHECQDESERQQFRSVETQQPVQADRHRARAWYGEPLVQRPVRRPRDPAVRQWQPPPSQWPADVTNPPDLWHSMDRPWVQEQFPEMNVICSTPVTVNQSQPQLSLSTQPPPTSAAEVQAISYCQLLGSDSPSLSSQVSNNLTNLTQQIQERRTSSTITSAREKTQDDDEAIPCP